MAARKKSTSKKVTMSNGANFAKQRDTTTKFIIIGVILVGLYLFGLMIAGLVKLATIGSHETVNVNGNVAVIVVQGPIMTVSDSGMFSDSAAVSSDIVKFIEDADKDTKIKAIVLEINSPGGSPVATDEISQAIKRAEKPVYSYIREVGASGAYWIASSTDRIFANKMSIVGSIGVIGSFLNFGGFLEDHNVTYERMIAGKYKDVGTPFREMDNDERDYLQEKIDMLHSIFREEVRTNRNLSSGQMTRLGEGQIFLGAEALTFGLVDELGGLPEVEAYLENELNTTVEFVRYTKKVTLLDKLLEVSSSHGYAIGRGMGSTFEAESVVQIRT